MSPINELKMDWRAHDVASGGSRAGMPTVLEERIMESGKGVQPTSDLPPPSYSP
jgi:hypothetical protein